MAGSVRNSLPRRSKIQRERRGRRTRCSELNSGIEPTGDSGPARVPRARGRACIEIHEIVVDVGATVCRPGSHGGVQGLWARASDIPCQHWPDQCARGQQEADSS